MTTADLIPLASVIIIDSSGTQQIITDTLVVPSISFGRSVSDLIPTCSVSVPGAHDIVLSPPQTIAVEYQSVVRFHGVVTNCSILWENGIPSTSIETSDMCYRLSHKLVPILAADWAAVTGMVGPCDFGTMTAKQIVEALLILCDIEGGDLISDATSPITSVAPGTTCLDCITSMASELGFVFLLYFTKVSGMYKSNGYFGLFEDLDDAGIL